MFELENEIAPPPLPQLPTILSRSSPSYNLTGCLDMKVVKARRSSSFFLLQADEKRIVPTPIGPKIRPLNPSFEERWNGLKRPQILCLLAEERQTEE